MGRLDVIDADLLGWWLAERQLNSGGLNGRPEKLPDVCYRFETCGLKFIECTKAVEGLSRYNIIAALD